MCATRMCANRMCANRMCANNMCANSDYSCHSAPPHIRSGLNTLSTQCISISSTGSNNWRPVRDSSRAHRANSRLCSPARTNSSWHYRREPCDFAIRVHIPLGSKSLHEVYSQLKQRESQMTEALTSKKCCNIFLNYKFSFFKSKSKN